MGQDELLVVCSGLATGLMVILASREFLRVRAQRKQEVKESADGGTMPDYLPSGGGKRRSVAGLTSFMRPKTVDELSSLRRRLARAGLRSDEAVDLISLGRTLALIAGVGLGIIIMLVTVFSAGGLLLGSALLAFGFYGPMAWLNIITNARQEKLNYSLPPTLDLLVTCMEAGLGLEQALARVAGETSFSDPEMADELTVVVGELKAGLSTGEAFKKLADRVTSDEIQTLTNVIVQSASLGAALGNTLREYAASARRRRELALEEAAGKVTAGLVLPLTMCLLPSAVIAMLGPAVIIVIRTLFE